MKPSAADPAPVAKGSTIVLDVGSSCTRIGVSGEEHPRSIFPTVTARPRDGRRPIFIGHDALNARGNFGFFYPIENGIIKDWKEVEQIFFHGFYSMRVASRDHPTLLSEPINSPKKEREKLTTYMFEEYNVPYLCLINSGVLSLSSAGKTTGLVIESGHYRTQLIPIHQGAIVSPAVQTLDWGGLHLTNYLGKLMGKTDTPLVRGLKEKFCYISLNYEEDRKVLTKSPSRSSDSKNPQLGWEKCQVPEVFFQPDLLDKKHEALPSLILNTLLKCDKEIQQPLLESIVLSGGNTMFGGFAERLTKELKVLLASPKFSSLSSLSSSLSIIASPNRIHSVWTGGSLIKADDEARKSVWISRAEYEETGSQIVHRKCQ